MKMNDLLTDDANGIIVHDPKEKKQEEVFRSIDNMIAGGHVKKALSKLERAYKSGISSESDHVILSLDAFYSLQDTDAMLDFCKKKIRLYRRKEYLTGEKDGIPSALFLPVLYGAMAYAHAKNGNKKQARYHNRTAAKIFVKNDCESIVPSVTTRILDNYAWLGLYDEAVEFAELLENSDKGINPREKELQTFALYKKGEFAAVLDRIEGVSEAELPEYNSFFNLTAPHVLKNWRDERAHKGRLQEHTNRRLYTMLANRNHTAFDPIISVDGITVDLKQDDDSIKILELNHLPASAIWGLDPYIKGSLEGRVCADYRNLTRDFQDRGLLFGEDTIDFCLEGADRLEFVFDTISTLGNGAAVHLNASLNTLMAQAYKDDFVLNAQACGLHDFIPHSVVIPRTESPDEAIERINGLSGDVLMFKKANAYRGDGVDMVPRGEVPNAVKALLNGDAWAGTHDRRQWESDYHPNFVVQEQVKSKPCRASDGHMYDGTMRAVLTHVFDHNAGTSDLIFHGMFWKLPRQPLSDKTSRDAVISLSKNGDVRRGRPFSARVSPQRQTFVKGQLKTFFDGFGLHLTELPQAVIERKVMDASYGNGSPQSLLAREQLCSNPYGNIMVAVQNRDDWQTLFRFNKIAREGIEAPSWAEKNPFWETSRSQPVANNIKHRRTGFGHLSA